MDSLAIAIGGILGACLRYCVGLCVTTHSGFPLATLVINVTGSLFLAWFYTITSEHWRIPKRLRIAVGTGFVGSYTTFSTFTVDTMKLIQNHHMDQAILYVLLSFVVGLLSAFVGYWLAVWQKRRSTSEKPSGSEIN